jgi:hypothetical protein
MISKKKKKNSKTRQILSQVVEVENESLTSFELAATVKTLTLLAENRAELGKSRYKEIRTCLWALDKTRKAEGFSSENNISTQIASALKDQRYSDAMFLLEEMRRTNQSPKLGCLQRWTREVDAVSTRDNHEMLRVLDSILRTADPSIVGCAQPQRLVEHPIRRMEPYCFFDPSNIVKSIITTDEKNKSLFKIVYQEKGLGRKPPNEHDMTLYSCPPLTIPQNPPVLPASKFDLPILPGVFILKNILSHQECFDILSAAESIGFTPDMPSGGTAKDLNSVLAHNFFWLADEELLERVYSRSLPFLPPSIQGQDIAGLNARWRVYRYTPGSIYRPHIDGAWPGSGLEVDGEYLYDAFGDRWSRLTYLIRLNEDFLGGATTYFTPSIDVGFMDATPICPGIGDVLIFPHGDTQGSFLHEGSPVLESDGLFPDAKYVIRTEVLYKVPGHSQRTV